LSAASIARLRVCEFFIIALLGQNEFLVLSQLLNCFFEKTSTKKGLERRESFGTLMLCMGVRKNFFRRGQSGHFAYVSQVADADHQVRNQPGEPAEPD